LNLFNPAEEQTKMKSVYVKIALLVMIVGLLAACAAQPAAIPTSTLRPTEEVLPTTQEPTDPPLPTSTIAPTESAAATEPAVATQPAMQGATVSFAIDILPMIESRCVNCHGGDRTEEGLVLRTHPDVIAGSDNGPVVIPGDAENSLLVELVTTQEMPKRGPKLTPPQIHLITEWVNQGALNN
jgi:mono/diheme cytochrome c family protein